MSDVPRASCTRCGASIREEVRCAWCARWSRENQACENCGAWTPERLRYVAARALVAAGVDALSLRARLDEVNEIYVARARESYRTQWLQVCRRLLEARACEALLSSKGYADEVEDELASSMPGTRKWVEMAGGEPEGPFEPTVASLTKVLEKSPRWRTRTLAAVALLRLGELSNEVIAHARHGLADAAPLRYEVALTLGSWRVRSRFTLDAWQRRYWIEVLDDALKEPAFRAATAAVRANLSGRLDEAHRAEVVALLRSDDADLRLEAALALGDVPTLVAELESEDADRRRAALKVLGRIAPERVLPELERGDEKARREALRWLVGPVTPTVLEALLSAAVRDDPTFRETALEKISSTAWDELDPLVRQRFATWLEEHAALVPLEQLLKLCDWAVLPRDPGRTFPLPREGDDVRAVVHATTHALRDAEVSSRVAAMRSRGFLAWLSCVRADERTLLATWLEQPEEGRELLEAIFLLQAQLHSYGDAPDDRAAKLLETLWAHSDEARERLVPVFAEVAANHSGMSGRDSLLARFWGRFVLHANERSAIARALEPWRRELHELADADPIAPGVEDPRVRFRIWADAEPKFLREHAERLAQHARAEWLADIARDVFARATALAATEPIQAVLAPFRVAAEIARLARGDAGERPEVQAAVAVLREQVPALRRAVEETRAGDEETRARARKLALEDYDVELRLIAEAEERREEALRREAERQAEQERRRQELEERERERAAEAAVQRARMEEVDRLRRAFIEGPDVAQSSRAPGSEPPPRPNRLRPVLPAASVDDEALVDSPLRTVIDYVECVKALSKGGDILSTLAQRGLDPMRWAQAAEAWGKVMGSRPDIAMRCGALLQAEWT